MFKLPVRRHANVLHQGMVLFHCTFLALRGQDGSFPVTKIKDDELGGELLLFGGYVQLTFSLNVS